jgi:hypothetical protein
MHPEGCRPGLLRRERERRGDFVGDLDVLNVSSADLGIALRTCVLNVLGFTWKGWWNVPHAVNYCSQAASRVSLVSSRQFRRQIVDLKVLARFFFFAFCMSVKIVFLFPLTHLSITHACRKRSMPCESSMRHCRRSRRNHMSNLRRIKSSYGINHIWTVYVKCYPLSVKYIFYLLQLLDNIQILAELGGA